MDEQATQQFVAGLDDIRGFEFATTAVMQDEPGEDGPDGFVGLVQAGLSLWNDHWHAQDESLTLAFLETEHRRRLFVGQDDETPVEFTRRIRSEAHLLQDPWLFVCVQGQATIGRAFDMSRAEGRARAFRTGLMQDAALWYAEARGRGAVDQCFGAIALEDSPRIFQSDKPQGASPMFTAILRGHPSRRRHRLRR